jgi:putative peptide zinc metalloprotease protein
MPGTELLGRVEGSALREPPNYIRRPDGQIVQVSELLFEFARHAQPGASDRDIAQRAGERLQLRITEDQVRYVLEHKLHALGVVTGPDGREPMLQRLDPLWGVHLRVGALRPATVNAIGRFFAPLFAAPVVASVVLALIALDAWFVARQGISQGLNGVIERPTLGLLLLALLYASMFFHECGHAAACRYGGGRPGGMGMGMFIVWPALYTDLTDSYRLGRVGRLRTDLGGVYFNGIYSLALYAAYFLTGFEPLLLAVAAQHVLAFNQFLPWMRLDGYYVISDLIGVPDLFARIAPVLRSLVPRSAPDPRVSELRPWARVAVSVWVITAVITLNAVLVWMIVSAPAYIERAWSSLLMEIRVVAGAASAGRVLELVSASGGALLLLLPVVGMLVTYILLCRRLGSSLAVFRMRPVLAAAKAAALRSGMPATARESA